MEPRSVHSIYFSPAHSTRKVVRAVSEGISNEVIPHDMTQGLKQSLEFTSHEIAVIGVPSYSGRVPSLAAEQFSKIKANGTPAILVCVYGNREYDDTLLELKDICTECGFVVISAGAFIARHSIFPAIASDRPTDNDLVMARDFGAKSLNYSSLNIYKELKLKGNKPYRAVGSIPLTPVGSSACDQCSVCSAMCPTGAINANSPRKTDKKLCIACARCIEVCPRKARRFKGILYKLVERKFVKNFSRRKEIELFFPE